MSGHPDEWSIAIRNRTHSNQPGGLGQPEQEMVRDFSPSDPIADHMRSIADGLRGTEMNHDQTNQIQSEMES